MSKTDAYTACVIGRAAVEMNRTKDFDEATNRAWDECESLADGLTDEDRESIFEFVSLNFDAMSNAIGAH